MRPNTIRTCLFLAIALLLGSIAAFGQQHPNIKKGFNVDSAYQIGEVDHINTLNGNLIVQVPIGPRFQVGGDLSYGLTATYNSKVWDYEPTNAVQNGKGVVKVTPTQRSNAGLGWLVSLGRILDPDNPSNKSGGVVYESPDGAEHAIYCTLHEDEKEPWPCAGITHKYANDPGVTQGYTRDGTYIRMRWAEETIDGKKQTVAHIEFPNGMVHVFQDDPVAAHRQLRIVAMRDRFGNEVKIEYPKAEDCRAGGNTDICWKITDSSSTDANKKRVHWVRFQYDQSQTPDNYDEKVIKVEIAQWNSSTPAVYDFVYDGDDETTTRGCVPANFTKEGSASVKIPRLRTIELPTGDTYQFDYNRDEVRDQCGQGGMKSLTFPTLGTISYVYQLYKLPTMHCDKNTVLNETPGIKTRTVTDTARGNVTYQWLYEPSFGPTERLCDMTFGVPFPIDISPEFKNTVTRKENNTNKEKVVHYFSVWPKLADSPTIGAKRHEFGLPFTRRVTQKVKDAHNQEVSIFLSTQTFNASGTEVSNSYVSYEADPKAKLDAWEPTTWDRNRRVLNTVTLHEDAGASQDKVAETFQDPDTYDGLGHYRRTDTNGNFGGSNKKTIFTNFNPGRKMPVTEGRPKPVPPTIDHDEPWLLETFEWKTVTENDKTLAVKYCFDNSGPNPTGFLNARRTMVSTDEINPGSALKQSNRDLLAVFRQTGGNLTSEEYYGGDAPHTTSDSGCSPKNGESPQYEITHTYDFGVLKTSTHEDSDFFFVNNVIDPYSGLVTESRDSAGIFTKFEYDSLGRITKVTPQTGNGASFSYLYDVREGSPTVDVKVSGSAGQIDRKFVRFDSLGRVWKSFDLMPRNDHKPGESVWSARQIDYDGQNRQSKVYQAVEVVSTDPDPDPGTFQPAFTDSASYTYDHLGRPEVITPPDHTTDADHTIKYNYYNGVAHVTETIRRINANGSGEHNTTVDRFYDRFGRLRQVKEFANNTSINALKGGEVTTDYTYDAADRLIKVDHSSQDRSFTYDGRGFLTGESHPESGSTTYGSYDARGHAGTRSNGGNTLTFDYDKAERLETITDQTGKVLKSFTYGKSTDGSAQGKLLTATRRNDVPGVGQVNVKETYQYDGAGGQVSKRTTLVERGDGEDIQEFVYDVQNYDDLLLPSKIKWPTCTGCPLPDGALDSLTLTRSAGHLTNVENFGSLTYHANGMVENVTHQTPKKVTDKYAVRNGIPRPSKITFAECADPAPYFLPGVAIAKTHALECGLQITWPAATTCVGGSAIKYRILRNNQDITQQSGQRCLTEPKFIDRTAVQGVEYTYRIIAEGPEVDGGTGVCNDTNVDSDTKGGLETEFAERIRGTRGSCNTDVTLEVAPVWTAFVGIPHTYKAFLKTPAGPVVDEELLFTLNGKPLNCTGPNRTQCTVKTGPDGSATATGSLDLAPKAYELKVHYARNVLPERTTIAKVNLFCGFPSYLVNPLFYNLRPEERTYPVFVGTSDHCTWTPNPDPGFITLPVPGTRTGTSTFDFKVSKNTELDDRSSKISVALKEVKVKQSGTGCSYGFDPEIAYVQAESHFGNVAVNVVTGPDCPWRVFTPPQNHWIRFVSAPGQAPPPADHGTGSRTIYIKVDPQELPSKRVADVQLFDQEVGGNHKVTMKLNQDAPPIPVPPKDMDVDLTGGSVSHGSNVTLRVWVREGTQLKYRWFINDRDVSPQYERADSITLHPGNEGYPGAEGSTFQVEVWNSRGKLSSKRVSWFNNTPNGSPCRVPYLSEGPFRPADAPLDSLSPFPGFNVPLFVYAEKAQGGSSPLKYEWFRGLSGDTNSEIPPDPPDANGISHPETIHVNPFHTSFYWVRVTDPDCAGGVANNSRTVAVFSAPPPPGRRRACCTFDTNSDNKSDMLWHNSVTGQNEIWLMNGTTKTSTVSLPSSLPKAQIQSAGDLDADGNLDLMFRNPETGHNEVWLMNRTSLRDVVQIESRPGKDWTIGAISDFDLDDHDDIVWHNGATGANEIWFGEGTEHLGSWALPNSGLAGLYGRGDFNGDEKPDLFLHNRTTGQNQIWIMNNAQRLAVNSADSPTAGTRTMSVSTLMVPHAEPGFVPAQVADFDGDGKPDVVWRNPTTGENSIWLMDGSQIKETRTLEARTDPNWQIGGGGNSNNPETGGGGEGGGGTIGDTPTSIELTTAAVAVGKPAIVTAVLKSGTTPLADREVVFSLSGTEVTRLLTDTDGSVTAVLQTTGRAAGTYTNAISAQFTGDSLYAASTKSVDLVITSETPKVTWNEPAPITYGTPLSATQLNATATAAGTFVYNPAAGTVLNAGYQTLSVKFTPSDSSLAAIETETVIMVNKAPSTIAWATPEPIAYGTPLSGAQLNATSPLAGSFTYNPAPGAILGIGTQTLQVTFEPDSTNYEVATASTTIAVGKGTQSILWNDPAPITVLQALSAAQLNAKILTSGTAPSGAVTYTPPIGTSLPAGTHELRVDVAATAEYLAASATVDIVVLRAQSTVQWATPAPIVYGTPLSSVQLNATSDIPGTFTYSHPDGTIFDAGTVKLFVVFTPADSRYDESTASVTLQVHKAQQAITWSKPASIVYGTPLTGVQLNARVAVVGPAPAGALTYSPEPDTILNAGLGQTLTVYADSTDNYDPAVATVPIDVLKAPQTIKWDPPAPIIYGTPLGAAQLNATVTVVGPAPAGALTYNPPAGTVLQAGNGQTLSVAAAETPNYLAATFTVPIDVLKQKPVLAWSQPAPIVYRTPLGTSQLNATSNVPGSFTYTPPAGTVLEAGIQPLSAHFTPTDTRNYEESDVATTIEVQQATPVITWPKPAGIVYGTALSSTQLNATADVPGTFTYDPVAGTILDAGNGQTLSMHFKPADTRNFKEVDAQVTIDVAKAKQTLRWTPPAIVYGTPLSSTQLNAQVTVVGPAPAGALVYTPPAGTVLDAGEHTLTVVAQETNNYESATLQAKITVNRAPLSLTVDAKSKLYGSPVPPLTGTLTGVVNNDPITAAYATTATLQSVVGQYPITGSLVDPNQRLFNYDVTITNATLTVLPAPLTISANPASKQYSDPIPAFTATYTGLVLGETPAVLTGTLVMQTTAEKLSAPGPYPITIGGLTSTNYAITYVGSTLTVLPEDARVIITSPLFTTVSSSGSATVLLSATVRDISATADAAGDTDPGDIRKATLKFVDRATGTTLCSGVIGLAGTSEQTGVATCTFTRNFGATLPATLTVGAKVGAYYTRDASSEDVVMNLMAPTPDQINGAGKFIVASAAGSHAPDNRSEAQVQIVLQYDNQGAVKGNFTLKFTRTENGTEHKYELTPVLSSLAIRRGTPATAMIAGTGTLVDTTTRQTIATSVPLFITATDSGDNKVADTIALTMLKSDGGIWLATGWNGVQNVALPLTNGQLVIVEHK